MKAASEITVRPPTDPDNRNETDSNSTGADGMGARRPPAAEPGGRGGGDGPRSASSNGGGRGLTIALIIGLVILAVVVATLICLLVYSMKTRYPSSYCKPQLPPVSPDAVQVVSASACPPPSCPPPAQTKTTSCQTFDHSFYVMKLRHRTPTSCLRRDYEDRLRPNCHYAMKTEFERIPRGPTDAADDARAVHNVLLNRSQVNDTDRFLNYSFISNC